MDIRSLSTSHRHPQDAPYVHKVGLPPKQNLFSEFKATVKETLFADDPLRPFKDQPGSKKFILGLQAIFPDVPCVVAQLILANPGPAVIDKLHASGSAQLIGEDKIFLTVADAVASCCPKSMGEV